MDTTTLMPVLIAALSASAVLLLVLGLTLGRQRQELRSRMSDYLVSGQGEPVNIRELELSEPFFQRVIAPVLRRMLTVMSWIWPRNRIEALKVRLLMAGRPGQLTANDFVGIKGWSMILLGGTAGLVIYLANYPRTPQTLAIWVLLAALGFFLPDIWLSRRIKQRQEEITRALPDTLDMMVVGVEAGLSFENAMLEITNKWRHALSLEMMQVQRDIGIGLSRRQALIDLNERIGVADVSQFVAAINQADELGVSISRVLSVQAEEMRIKRRQRAQEAANQAPIKMLFPMVFLIFPALFAVLLGPGVPSLLQAMGGL
jgi:tight adherence protein C